MKKILFFLGMVISISIWATTEVRTSTDVNVITDNRGDENYVKVFSRVECKLIPKGESGHIGTSYCDVYKRKNMSGGYYLEYYWNYYTPIYKNTSSTYKGVNVSSYKYYAETKDYMYFFSF